MEKKKTYKDEIYPSKMERRNVHETRYVRGPHSGRSSSYRGRIKKPGFWKSLSLTDILIIINAIVFLFISITFNLTVPGEIDETFDINNTFLRYIAVNPTIFFQGFVWTIFTSVFAHLIFLHLFVNMISLYFIGNFVEKLIGRKRYLWFFLIAGIVGSLFYVIFAWFGTLIPNGELIFGGVNVPALGASGALFGLGGFLSILLPRLKVLLMFFIPMPLWIAMVFLMFGFWIASIFGGLPIGNTAHLGGLVVGIIYGLYIRKKYARKVRILNRMFG